MNFKKPKFWDLSKPNFISYMLSPFTLFIRINNFFLDNSSLSKSKSIKTICVGNIYLGGTGKTPLSILIAQELVKHNKKPAVVKKYYREHFDEHALINNSIKNLFLDKQRYKAIVEAEGKHLDIAILDDGFQD